MHKFSENGKNWSHWRVHHNFGSLSASALRLECQKTVFGRNFYSCLTARGQVKIIKRKRLLNRTKCARSTHRFMVPRRTLKTRKTFHSRTMETQIMKLNVIWRIWYDARARICFGKEMLFSCFIANLTRFVPDQILNGISLCQAQESYRRAVEGLTLFRF